MYGTVEILPMDLGAVSAGPGPLLPSILIIVPLKDSRRYALQVMYLYHGGHGGLLVNRCGQLLLQRVNLLPATQEMRHEMG